MRIMTAHGRAQVSVEGPREPGALLVLTHGSGGGVDAPDLLAVRDAAVGTGVAVARVLQPYRVAGRRAPGNADRQDAAWCAVVEAVREAVRAPYAATVSLVVGGRSNGARVACRTADRLGATGVVALAFPLHPPGRPERSRRTELDAASAGGAAILVVNGARDPFGIPEPAGGRVVRVLDGEAHPLSRRPARVGELVAEWLGAIVTPTMD